MSGWVGAGSGRVGTGCWGAREGLGWMRAEGAAADKWGRVQEGGWGGGGGGEYEVEEEGAEEERRESGEAGLVLSLDVAVVTLKI